MRPFFWFSRALLVAGTLFPAALFVATTNAFVLPSVAGPSGSSRRQAPSRAFLSSSPSRLWATPADEGEPSSQPQSQRESLNKDEIERYSRHLVLSDVGMTGQARLKNAAVLCIGAGGLGSPCLLYLAAAGVGHIGIVDADTVDTSNLQRQVIHGTSTVGMSKCQSAAQRIKDLNPHVNVRLYEQEFTSQTALPILQDGFEEGRPYDVVIDGSDNFPTKYLINDACALSGIPWVYAAILGFEGQVSVFNYLGGPDYRDLLPTPPPPGDVPSCAEGGVVGVLPGTLGCLQATECIKLLLQKGHVLSGRILVLEALEMKFTEVGLDRSADRAPITELLDYQGFCGAPQTVAAPASETATGQRTMDEESNTAPSSIQEIDPTTCLERLREGWSPWVLDVRLPTENDIVALPFTDRVVPHRTVQVRDVPPLGDVLVYCKGGVRSIKACEKLIEQGVESERLYSLEGGILSWQEQVDPSMPRY